MTLNKLFSCLAAVALAVYVSGCNKANDTSTKSPANDPAPSSNLGETGNASDMMSNDTDKPDDGDADGSKATTDDDSNDAPAENQKEPEKDPESGSTN